MLASGITKKMTTSINYVHIMMAAIRCCKLRALVDLQTLPYEVVLLSGVWLVFSVVPPGVGLYSPH